jgi:AmpE protein
VADADHSGVAAGGVAGLLLLVLEPVAYGLLALPVHLLVVIYSLGRGDLLGWPRAVSRRLASRRPASGRACGQTRSGHLRRQRRAVAGRVQGHLLWEAYQSFFAVIFWYFVLGPVAALAYRLLALAEENSQNPALAERAAVASRL